MTTLRRLLVATCAWATAATALACGDRGEQSTRPDVVVAAASSLREPLERCAGAFGGARVRLALGGSDQLATRIRQGTRPDVYIAADQRLARRLAAEGLLERPVPVATNRLVVAVAGPAPVRGLEDLAAPGLDVALGSASVPVGAYARGVLARLPAQVERGILANVRSVEPDVTGVVGKLQHGAVDAGIVYASDVAAGRLRAVPIPAGLGPRVVYAAGVVAGSEHPRAARRFIDGLRTGPCARAMQSAGFGPAP